MEAQRWQSIPKVTPLGFHCRQFSPVLSLLNHCTVPSYHVVGIFGKSRVSALAWLVRFQIKPSQISFSGHVVSVYNTRIDGCVEKRKNCTKILLFYNSSISHELVWNLGTYCLYLIKNKWIFQEFWRLLFFFFLSFRRRGKLLPHIKEVTLIETEHSRGIWWKTLKFKHDEVPERTLRSNCFDLQEGNDVTRVCWAGVMWLWDAVWQEDGVLRGHLKGHCECHWREAWACGSPLVRMSSHFGGFWKHSGPTAVEMVF